MFFSDARNALERVIKFSVTYTITTVTHTICGFVFHPVFWHTAVQDCYTSSTCVGYLIFNYIYVFSCTSSSKRFLLSSILSWLVLFRYNVDVPLTINSLLLDYLLSFVSLVSSYTLPPFSPVEFSFLFFLSSIFPFTRRHDEDKFLVVHNVRLIFNFISTLVSSINPSLSGVAHCDACSFF